MAGILYIVSTPIGNLADITLRAIKTLKEVDLILAEDTRHTRILLKHYEIEKPLISFFEFNEQKRIPEIIDKLRSGAKIAQVTDAGTPLISDPGFKLVRKAIEAGIEVEPIPGPSAALAALTASGMPTDKFLFLGYLPKSAGKSEKLLKNAQKILEIQKMTIILFESPHRLVKTLTKIKDVFGDIEIAVCRELTKIHQEIRREKVRESLEHFAKVKPKGEFTLVF